MHHRPFPHKAPREQCEALFQDSKRPASRQKSGSAGDSEKSCRRQAFSRGKRIGCAALCAGMLFSLAACQPNPDSSIVKNKNMDRLIEMATGDGGDVLSAEYDTYQNTIQDDNLHVSVYIDAQVDIPQTDKMSVFRVQQKPITDDLLAKARTLLARDAPLYDDAYLHIETKADLEDDIAAAKRALQEAPASNKEAYEYQLNSLLEDYEAAPASVSAPEEPNDGKLHPVKDYYNRDKNNSYYEWMYTLNPDGDAFSGVGRAKDGSYISLYAQNNADLGNLLRFRKNPREYETVASGVAYTDILSESSFSDASLFRGALSAEEIKDSQEYQMITAGLSAEEAPEIMVMPEDTCSLTRENAIQQADAFLKSAGLSGYSFFEGDLCTERTGITTGFHYRTYYILIYKQKINGAFLINSGEKFDESWNNGSYSKKEWGEESIVLRVNDNGIVGVDYNSPVEITETVVDNAAMSSFAEIQSVFEKMATVSYANEHSAMRIDIDRVQLSYTRISEPDNFSSGLLVPVWDFIGTVQYLAPDGNYYDCGHGRRCVMTINAIDHSIIDRELGY